MEILIPEHSPFRMEILIPEHSPFRMEILIPEHPSFCTEIMVVDCPPFHMEILYSLPEYCLCHHLPFTFIKKNQITVKYIVVVKLCVPVNNTFGKQSRPLPPRDLLWHSIMTVLLRYPLFFRHGNRPLLPAVLRNILMTSL